MEFGKWPLQYNSRDLVDTPGLFEDDLLNAFSSAFSEDVNCIFAKMELLSSSNIWYSYKSRIERHFFPALAVATVLKLDKDLTVDICAAFGVGFSLPVIMLDELLDNHSDTSPTTNGSIEFLKFVYQANHFLSKQRYHKATQCFNRHYVELMISMERENQLKFSVPRVDIVDKYKGDILNRSEYYRSECHYFEAIVEGLLSQSAHNISKDLSAYLRVFGLLRQISDEIPDVEEDLQTGLITLPLLFAHQSQDLSVLISEYWQGFSDFKLISRVILNVNGYEMTYQLGSRLYHSSHMLKEDLSYKYPFIEQIALFIDWRFAFLNRLKLNNWTDIRKINISGC